MKKLLSILFLLMTIVIVVPAQQIDRDDAREELERKGIDEDEIRKRMLARGINIDNIDPTNSAEVLRAEKALEEVIAELEKANEKAVTSATTKLANEAAKERAEDALEKEAKNVAKEDAQDIRDAVKDGASLDEAIAEELVDNVQESLPKATIYGQHVFRDKSISVFSKSNDVRPPDSYILGVGDRINISIWGASQKEASYNIEESGYIKPDKMPRINLKGISFKKAKDLLRKRFAEYYRFGAGEFEVTISFARTITVNIYGEVFNPGGYTLPATNTAFNALVAAGGPSNIGTVRNIKLIRAGEPAQTIDVYDYLNNPNVQSNFYLQDNDIIHVPISEKIVTISGAVKKPFKYELLKGENLNEVIDYAGGLKDNAYQGNIKVKRFIDDEEKIIDINYRSFRQSNKNFDLLSGDKVSISDIPKPYKNYVEIGGAVEYGGQYEMLPGMKVSDLISKSILAETARTDIAFMQRTNPDGTIKYIRLNLNELITDTQSAANVALQPKDKLIVYGLAKFVDKAQISIEGAVRDPSSHPFSSSEDIRVSEAIILAGGLRIDATDFGYIHRKEESNRKQKEYIRINLKAAIENPNSPDNIVLKPNDVLKVYSNLTYTDDTYINIDGAVRNPGQYKYDESLKLDDVLTLAGGLRLNADFNRIDIFRVEIKDNEPTQTVAATIEVDDQFLTNGNGFELRPYDYIIVRAAPEFEFQRNIVVRGEVKYPGLYALVDDNQKLSTAIEQAGGLTNEAFPEGATLYREKNGIGYVVMNLKEAMRSAGSNFNYILKEGDIIQIPKNKDLVSITGATKAPEIYADKLVKTGKINVAHYKGKNAKWYVDEFAAGIGGQGSRRLITVEHPNGEIERTKNFLVFNKYPEVRKGSIITVGRKKVDPKKEDKKDKKDIDWGKVLADSVTQATAILTLILLIQRVN